MLLLQGKGHVKADYSNLKNITERGDHKGGEASVVEDVEDLNNQGDLLIITDSRINSITN